MRLLTITFAFALAVIVVAVASPTATAQVAVQEPAPELDGAKDAAGKRVTLKSLRGKNVVLDFCAVWAKNPCKKLLAEHEELAGRLDAKKTVVLVLMVDNGPDTAKRFVKALRYKNVRFAYMPEERSLSFDKYGIEMIPMSFLIDRKGVVQYVQKGVHDGDTATLEEEIKKLPEK